MWEWLRGKGTKRSHGSPKADQLTGAPVHARVKTYSAETGLVYQYVYRGHRRTEDDLGAEHVFDAQLSQAQRGSPSRQFPISVCLLDAEIASCERAIGRELIAAERYAVVKMTLFAALDEFQDSSQWEAPLIPLASKMETHLRILGRI